jgi:hypothetical protein
MKTIRRIRPRLEVLEDRAVPSAPAAPMGAGNGPPDYKFQTIDGPKGTTGATLAGISNNGAVVGNYGDAGGNHGFTYQNGKYAVINDPQAMPVQYGWVAPNGGGTIAAGINNSGQVAGWYTYNDGTRTPFVEGGGKYTDLGLWPYSYESGAWSTGINDKGQVAGWMNDGYGEGPLGYEPIGWVTSVGGDVTEVPAPGMPVPKYTPPTFFVTGEAEVYGINNNGDVVGSYSMLSGETGGFLCQPNQGQYATSWNWTPVPGGAPWDWVGSPGPGGGQYTTYANFTPFSVNDNDVMLGTLTTGGTTATAILSGGQFTVLTASAAPPKATGYSWVGINDSNQLVGNYTDAKGVTHGFIATPQNGNGHGNGNGNGPAIATTPGNGAASQPSGLVTPNGKLSGQTLSSALPAPVTLGLTAGALGLSPGTDAATPTARAGAVAGKPSAEAFSAFSAAVVGDPSAIPSSSTASKDALFAGSAHGGLLSDLDASLSQDPYTEGHQQMSA